MRRALFAAILALTAAAALPGCALGGTDEHGAEVLRYAIHSRATHGTRAQVAVRPAHAVARPPLLVFLHGRGSHGEESNDNSAFFAALSKLGRRAPAVVFPNGGEASYWHDRRGGRWDAYVMREVIPAAIRRLHADPRRVAIGGISMGGFGAYDIARRHPGRFCAVGAHSGALWLSGGASAAGAFDDAEDFARNDVIRIARTRGRAAWPGARLWIDGGSADPFRIADDDLARALGVRHHIWPGGHTGGYWHAHYGAYLRFYAGALAACRR